ncbi:unnamed protein product [Candida verbasci]|uniref:DNA repair protein RAD50 n=1 Tax=Candida verbasci TaxID=1227364 RepID=A0A9W4XDV9_9ASCO|nr:unnamed protein product [Candida verbasci]
MSSIYKLSIKGIRAFEPENDETIQFGFPLTLICGQNGCGKTTIIECLKYATTGNLPPNSKGGAFVHDPSLSSRTIVNGQVKLAFKNVNGKSMITTRSVQASMKSARTTTTSGAITFKTMEGQLSLIERGEKISISSKTAELDSQIPIYLGASTSILDNVIFCHQDDSLWPLSEPAVLKKKFDDIFEASKFTKVLDQLKTIKKDMTNDIKFIEQSVQHLKVDRDRAKKVEVRLKSMNESVDKFTTEISELNLKIEDKEKQAEQLFASNQEFQKTLSDYENLQMKKKQIEEQLERTKQTIEILHESDEELLIKQENFASLTMKKQEKIDQMNKDSDSINKDLKQKTNDYNELIRLDGSLKSKKSEYETNLETIAKIINEHAESLNVNLSNDTSTNILKFKPVLEKTFKSKINSQKKLINDNKSAETEKQSSLQESINAISREEQHQEYTFKDIENYKQKLTTLKKKVVAGDNDEIELESKRSELEHTQNQLQTKKNLDEVKDLDSKIIDANSEISKLEFSLDELSKKLTASNKQSDLILRVTFLQESTKSKSEKVDKLTKSINDDFKKVVGNDVNNESEIQLNEKLSILETDLDSQQKKVMSLKGDLESNKKTIKSINKEHEENENKFESLKQEITKIIEESEIEDYENIVQDLEESFRNVQEDLNTSEVTKDFKNSALELANKSKCCLLCKRSFDSDGLEKFIIELRKSVDETKIQEIKNQANDIKKELDDTKAINLKVIQYKECIHQSKELKSRLEALQKQQTKFNDTSKQEQSKLDTMKQDLNFTLQLKKPISDITRLNSEIQEVNGQIDEINEDLSGFGTIVLSITELQKQQQDTNSKIKELRTNLNEYTEEKYKVQREIQRLENKIKDTKLQISNLEKSLAEITAVKSSITENERLIQEAEIKLKTIRSTLEDLQTTKDERQKAYKDVQKRNRESEEKMQAEVLSIQELSGKFNSINESIIHYETNLRSKLEENTIQMNSVTKEIDTLNKKLSENSTKIKSLEKEVMDASRIEHNILANIDYRTQINNLDETDFQLNAIDISDAQTQKQQYHENSKKLREELSELTSEHAGKIGEVKQIKDQIATLKKELETEYKDVNKNYHEEWIKLQTNMLVSNDIQSYSKALDNAIMKYHSIKMEDINRILNELWSQTYKGSDISTIAIKSDVNLQAKGNRSYNYRVVMVKDSSELDMRGRCSAGQKVLASILIRLALAECFGANCGMIALDEPTTNLDNENAEALAAALNKIIEYRKQQSNFQLIVITHDEKFLTHIQGDRFTDHFYRIQRDEKSKSRIYSLPIDRIEEG